MEIRVLHILLAVTREKIRTDKEYVGIRELIPTIVNEFVKKIIVRAPEKYIEYRWHKIEIVWNFIVELEQDEDKQTIERCGKSRTA